MSRCLFTAAGRVVPLDDAATAVTDSFREERAACCGRSSICSLRAVLRSLTLLPNAVLLSEFLAAELWAAALFADESPAADSFAWPASAWLCVSETTIGGW